MVFNIQYKLNLPEFSKNLSSLMYTCKKLSACCCVVRTLQEGYMNKNCCSLTHRRVPELENVVSLAFPYEKLTKKHLSHRSYQVSDAFEAALSKRSRGNSLEGGQALPPLMMTATLRSPSCSQEAWPTVLSSVGATGGNGTFVPKASHS